MAADGNLLTEVQRDALDAAAPLADTLRKLVALGGVAGSTELREWASMELRGYIGSDVELPEYRKPGAVLKVDAIRGNMLITGQQISPRFLPEFAREYIKEEVLLASGVGEIHAMLRRAEADGGSVSLTIPNGQDLVAIMNQESEVPFQHINTLYWTLSAPAIAGVLDRIRTTLVELVAEMRAGMPDSADTPSPEVADHAVNVVVHGKDAQVSVTAASASGSGFHTVRAHGTQLRVEQVEASWPALREELTALDIPPEELDALHTALTADGDPTGAQLGPATTGWIGQLSTKVASGAVALSAAASTEAVSHVILKALGLV